MEIVSAVLRDAQRALHRFSARAQPLLGYTFPSAADWLTEGGSRRGERKNRRRGTFSEKSHSRDERGNLPRPPPLKKPKRENQFTGRLSRPQCSPFFREISRTIYTRPTDLNNQWAIRFFTLFMFSYTSVDFAHRISTRTVSSSSLIADARLQRYKLIRS
jgi:hypothetical protein